MVESRWFLYGWCSLAVISIIIVLFRFETTLPVFTFIWIGIPVIAVMRGRPPRETGFRRTPAGALWRTTAVNLLLLGVAAAVVEPWSGAYGELVRLATESGRGDPTFVWLERFPGAAGYVGLLLFSGCVSIFAEELFFRGWLLQILRRRMDRVAAIVLQAALFTVPQLIPAFIMGPSRGVAYAVVYSFLAVGCVGGWAAERTKAIWPSLVSAAVWNLALTAVVRWAA